MTKFFDACRVHLKDAATHMEKGRALYAEAEELPGFDHCGRCFALALDELNKLHALRGPIPGPMPLPLRETFQEFSSEHHRLSCGALLNLAQCNLKAARYRAALENAEEALSLEKSAKAYYRKALALEGLGLDVQALPMWQKALREAPKDPMIRQKLTKAIEKVKEQRCWEARAFRGALGSETRSEAARAQRAERLQQIVRRACEYVNVGDVRRGELLSLCTTLVSTGELDTHEVEALNALFAQSITCTQPGLPDLELSKDEVTFLDSLNLTLPGHSQGPRGPQPRARVAELLQRLRQGLPLGAEEEHFLREEQQRLEAALG
ncbi:unnamed protein product [Durusdinium trenchii]